MSAMTLQEIRAVTRTAIDKAKSCHLTCLVEAVNQAASHGCWEITIAKPADCNLTEAEIRRVLVGYRIDVTDTLIHISWAVGA